MAGAAARLASITSLLYPHCRQVLNLPKWSLSKHRSPWHLGHALNQIIFQLPYWRFPFWVNLGWGKSRINRSVFGNPSGSSSPLFGQYSLVRRYRGTSIPVNQHHQALLGWHRDFSGGTNLLSPDIASGFNQGRSTCYIRPNPHGVLPPNGVLPPDGFLPEKDQLVPQCSSRFRPGKSRRSGFCLP